MLVMLCVCVSKNKVGEGNGVGISIWSLFVCAGEWGDTLVGRDAGLYEEEWR